MPFLTAKRRPNNWRRQAADVDPCKTTVPLPYEQQKSEGMKILQMIQEHKQSDSDGSSGKSRAEETADVDVKVIIKHTFVEVVDPRPKRITRSMSDSGLDLDNFMEKQWICESPLQKKISTDNLLDLSDASTDDLEGCSREFSFRGDSPTSDDDGALENLMPTCDAYSYVEPWWSPKSPEGMDEGRFAKQSGPQLNAEAKPFVPMHLAQMPLAGVESPVAERLNWARHGLKQEALAQEWHPEPASNEDWQTTVMLRNMPNNYTRGMLLELVDEKGFRGTYDFAYLPIDFSSQAGLGYAFINFVSPEKAQRCFDVFEGFSDWKVPSEKVCTVTWSSPYQGLESHIERYRNSPVMHQSIIDEWKPVLFRNGVRMPFPPPTKAMKAPKIRQQPPLGGVQLQ
jgi:hypothetical protein